MVRVRKIESRDVGSDGEERVRKIDADSVLPSSHFSLSLSLDVSLDPQDTTLVPSVGALLIIFRRSSSALIRSPPSTFLFDRSLLLFSLFIR